MDLSKLPKLSQTDAPPPTGPETTPLPRQPAPPPGVGADVWFDTAIGVLVVYLGRTFGAYLMARLTGRPFDTGATWNSDNSPVPYFQLENFQALSDAGVFLFGVVILLEAAMKAWLGIAGKVPRPVSGFAAAAAIVMVGLNIFACGKLMGVHITPIISFLAVAYGGYIVFDLASIFRNYSGKPAVV